MPHDLEYIVDKAVMRCNCGVKNNFFNGTHNNNVKISGKKVCIASDKESIINIPEFGICEITQAACVPAPTLWTDTYKVKVKGQQTLLFKSKLPCSIGGSIEFSSSGQIPISPDELNKMNEEYAEDPPEDEGLSWWDAVEMVPFVGGVVGTVRSVAKGDIIGAGLSILSVGADVIGPLTGGAGNVGSAAIKTAKLGRTAMKVAKAASKVKGAALTAGGKLLTKTGARKAAAAISKQVDKLAEVKGIICVFSCFAEKTPIHTKNGIKNIEDIKQGDFVWAWDEKTGKTDLKKVHAVFSREVDATLQIKLEDEAIETTAEHPFYTDKGWKEAADITHFDTIKTKDNKWYKVKESSFLYEKKKVYNFEVQDWHTYFVGKLAWLVHNAKVCNEIFDSVEKILSSVKTERLKGGIRQGFIKGKGNGEDIFNSITKGGKKQANGTVIMPDGTVINKHYSTKNPGVYTIDIKKDNIQYKMRVTP